MLSTYEFDIYAYQMADSPASMVAMFAVYSAGSEHAARRMAITHLHRSGFFAYAITLTRGEKQ